MEFDFSFAEGTSWEHMVAFEIAGEMWSEYLADSMTVNIHVEMTNLLPENVVGGALPAMVTGQDYGEFIDAMEADITSWGDEHSSFPGLSIKNENGESSFEARVDLGAEVFLADSSSLTMTRANAKALGMLNPNSQELDGYILMSDLSSTSLNWADHLNWTGDTNTLDFLSVAVHEIGHVLGFVSSLDRAGSLYFANSDDLQAHFNYDPQAIQAYLDSALERATPFDMQRYSQESLTMGEQGAIDLSVGTQAYFGKNNGRPLSTGKNIEASGDGFQASHWKQKNNELSVHGIMDPLLRRGATRRISNRDLKAMDSIGYDFSAAGLNIMKSAKQENKWLFSDFQMNIGNLEIAAKNNLAQDLYNSGAVDSVYWWNHNQEQYFSQGTQNREQDVEEMIRDSEVYEAARGSRRTRYRMEAYFNEFLWQELDNMGVPDTAIASNLIETKAEPVATTVDSQLDDSEALLFASVIKTEVEFLGDRQELKISAEHSKSISEDSDNLISNLQFSQNH